MSQKSNGDAKKCGDNKKCCGNGDANYKLDLSSRKAQLSPTEYRVTQERQTERPYSNKYNRHWEPGSYHCIVCDTELFRSNTKFESKSGWPAFSNVVDVKRVKLTPDLSHIGANLLLLVAKPDLARTEVSCSHCNAHLGHLFKDGPKPTGLRYCINSSSLNFVAGNPLPSTAENDETYSEPTQDKIQLNSLESREGSKSQKSYNNPPPMATLCLNNQSTPCQRINSSNNFVRGSSKYASSGSAGASLTAARISFFQQRAAQQQSAPPVRSFGTTRNGNLPNRFVNSTSSGSLNFSTNNTINGGAGSNLRRRNSAGLFPNMSKIEQVSSAPKVLVLRETSL